MVRIFLVRHGHTSAKEAGVFSSEDTALSKTGERQVAALRSSMRALLENGKFACYTSSYKRAIQTANIATDGLDVDCKVLDFIHELSYPKEIEGRSMTDEEAVRLYETFKKEWWTGKRFEGTETFAEFKARADVLYRFALTLKRDAVFFTHGNFIKLFMARVLFGEQVTADDFAILYHNTIVENASISVFDVRDGRVVLTCTNSFTR